MEKYGIDGDFRDPAIRCYTCNKVVLMENVYKIGRCPHCGNRKWSRLVSVNDEEKAWLSGKGVDPDFLALFNEEVPDA
jgi:predicted RNA-binding Zn-ribbon protein involved in translation (DUF1610 family)